MKLLNVLKQRNIMQIISHRGLWSNPSEKNSINSFENSIKEGFGLETDIRDFSETLVVSHDPANKNAITIEEVLSLFSNCSTLPLFLNIKSDGLANSLKNKLEQYNIKEYYFFDMSVPETISFINLKLNFFTRQSEFELIPAFYAQAHGIWLDSFQTDWFDNHTINEHLLNKKKVAIVSPELHRRPYMELWGWLKKFELHQNLNIYLCTDFPIEAKIFFNL